MDDRVAQIAASFDAVAVPLGLERMETLGEDGSGAQNFYAVRLRRGTIFSDYDLALARALVAWTEAPRLAHEIGGGFGGLSILLAALGFQTTCLEVDAARFAGAQALLGELQGAFPILRGACRMVKARFPVPCAAAPAAGGGGLLKRLRGLLSAPAAAPVAATASPLPAEGAMALITNLVFTTTNEAKHDIVAALRSYRFSIVDVDRFLTKCVTPEERAARLAEFQAAGLVGEPFLDLGLSACFYRFTAA